MVNLRQQATLALGVSGVFIALAICRSVLWTYGADTGTFVQVINDAWHGMRNGIEHGTHYRFHWSPSLILLWPLLATVKSGLSIQIIQVLATVATAPLLCELFRPYLGAKLAARLGILALLYPPLDAIAFNEFHELGLSTPLVVGAVLAADRERWRAMAVCVAVLVGLREDVCLILALVGLGVAFALRTTRPPQARAAFATACAALCSFGVYYGLVVPRVGGWQPASFYRYPFATGPLTLIVSLVERPNVALPAILTTGRFTYILEALAPVALLPLWTPWGFLALPGFCVVLLANSGLVWRMGMHYAALWIPWLLIATGCAAARIAKDRGEPSAARALSVALVISCLVLIAFDPMHPAHYLQASYPDLAAARRALHCVPQSASLATHDEWFSAVAASRPRATVGVVDGVDYLVYADDYPNAQFQTQLRPLLAAQIARQRYRVVCAVDHVRAYARVGIAGSSPVER